jgi:hypothetical protein
VVTVEASRITTYVDAGAHCSDEVDGAGLNVWTTSIVGEVSSGMVDLEVIGRYVIRYKCTNSLGGSTSARRTVYVRDQECPVCVLVGSQVDTVEASFPFVDQGAHCTDTFSPNIKTDVTGSVNVETTGIYHLTYNAADAAGNSASDCAQHLIRTVVVTDSMKPVLSVHYRGHIVRRLAELADADAPDARRSMVLVCSLGVLFVAIFVAAEKRLKFQHERPGGAEANFV